MSRAINYLDKIMEEKGILKEDALGIEALLMSFGVPRLNAEKYSDLIIDSSRTGRLDDNRLRTMLSGILKSSDVNKVISTIKHQI